MVAGRERARREAPLERVLAGHAPPVVGLVMAFALLLAWMNRFVMDDAFISFTYARNLVEGHGLTWFGARVEGYSNFLWVLWVALGMKLGIDPIQWSQAGGLAAFAATLFALWRLALVVLESRAQALLALLLFCTNYTVLCFATGGLETMLQTSLLTLAMLAAHRTSAAAPGAWRSPALLSLLLAAAVLDRPDSALPAAILGGWALVTTLRRPGRARALAALTVPFTLIVGSWLGWKWSYYGRLLPNSYYAKVGLRPVMISNGMLYVGRFLHWYWLWPIFAAGLLALWLRRPARAAPLRPIVWFVLAWLTYVALVGGDFMEFRFLVPVTPCLFLLLAWLAGEVIGRRLLRRPALASLVVLASSASASVIHARTFHGITPDHTLDSIGVLKTGYAMCPDGNWGRVGNLLRASFASVDPIIAVHAAGAIPYYSRFRSVDMLGINDRWVAEHGDPAPRSYRRPGHQRRAPMRYLRARGVQIVIAHPTIVLLRGFEYPQIGSFLARWVEASFFATRPDSSGQFTFALMPVTPDYGLLLWLLAPTPAIDSIVVANHWPTQTFLAQPLVAPDTTGAQPGPRSTP